MRLKKFFIFFLFCLYNLFLSYSIFYNVFKSSFEYFCFKETIGESIYKNSWEITSTRVHLQSEIIEGVNDYLFLAHDDELFMYYLKNNNVKNVTWFTGENNYISGTIGLLKAVKKSQRIEIKVKVGGIYTKYFCYVDKNESRRDKNVERLNFFNNNDLNKIHNKTLISSPDDFLDLTRGTVKINFDNSIYLYIDDEIEYFNPIHCEQEDNLSTCSMNKSVQNKIYLIFFSLTVASVFLLSLTLFSFKEYFFLRLFNKFFYRVIPSKYLEFCNPITREPVNLKKGDIYLSLNKNVERTMFGLEISNLRTKEGEFQVLGNECLFKNNKSHTVVYYLDSDSASEIKHYFYILFKNFRKAAVLENKINHFLKTKQVVELISLGFHLVEKNVIVDELKILGVEETLFNYIKNIIQNISDYNLKVFIKHNELFFKDINTKALLNCFKGQTFANNRPKRINNSTWKMYTSDFKKLSNKLLNCDSFCQNKRGDTLVFKKIMEMLDKGENNEYFNLVNSFQDKIEEISMYKLNRKDDEHMKLDQNPISNFLKRYIEDETKNSDKNKNFKNWEKKDGNVVISDNYFVKETIIEMVKDDVNPCNYIDFCKIEDPIIFNNNEGKDISYRGNEKGEKNIIKNLKDFEDGKRKGGENRGSLKTNLNILKKMELNNICLIKESMLSKMKTYCEILRSGIEETTSEMESMKLEMKEETERCYKREIEKQNEVLNKLSDRKKEKYVEKYMNKFSKEMNPSISNTENLKETIIMSSNNEWKESFKKNRKDVFLNGIYNNPKGFFSKRSNLNKMKMGDSRNLEIGGRVKNEILFLKEREKEINIETMKKFLKIQDSVLNYKSSLNFYNALIFLNDDNSFIDSVKNLDENIILVEEENDEKNEKNEKNVIDNKASIDQLNQSKINDFFKKETIYKKSFKTKGRRKKMKPKEIKNFLNKIKNKSRNKGKGWDNNDIVSKKHKNNDDLGLDIKDIIDFKKTPKERFLPIKYKESVNKSLEMLLLSYKNEGDYCYGIKEKLGTVLNGENMSPLKHIISFFSLFREISNNSYFKVKGSNKEISIKSYVSEFILRLRHDKSNSTSKILKGEKYKNFSKSLDETDRDLGIDLLLVKMGKIDMEAAEDINCLENSMVRLRKIASEIGMTDTVDKAFFKK